MFRFYNHMTQDQMNCVDDFKKICKSEIATCIEWLKKTISAEVKLPATAVSGLAVLHGANCEIASLEQYWTSRLNAMYYIVSDEDFKEWTGHSSTIKLIQDLRGKHGPKRNRVSSSD